MNTQDKHGGAAGARAEWELKNTHIKKCPACGYEWLQEYESGKSMPRLTCSRCGAAVK